MNVRFSLFDLDIDTTSHEYGVFFCSWFSPQRVGSSFQEEHPSVDRSLFRLEFSPLLGFEIEVLCVKLVERC